MARLLTLHHPGEAAQYYAAGLWQRDSLYDLVRRWANERADLPALRDANRRLTWSQLQAEVDTVAETLRASGLTAGERVSVWLSNRIEAVVIFIACSRNGYVFNTSLHHTYTVEEVVTLLERVSCRAFFGESLHGADGSSADIFSRVAALPCVKVSFHLQPRQGGGGQFHERALPYPVQHVPAAPAPPQDPDQIVYLAFTSGTTGAPKGVMHSDNSLLANARAMVFDWGHDANTILLTLSQMSHHIGTVALCQALVGGFELVLSHASSGAETVALIERTAATYVMGVPTHAIDILAELHMRGASRLGKVTVFYIAGAPIAKQTANALLSLGVKPQNVYGMTENGSHQYTLPTDDVETITSTCGRACRAYEIRLFRQDNPDLEVEPGQIGQIGGRGAMRMLGYFANQAATETVMNVAGWLMSGDLGCFDPQGNLRVVGRLKDVIIRGGHNIHPAQIEDLALKHPAVLKAAVVAVADERLGERVCLVICARSEASPPAEDLLQHLHAQGLSKFDMPEYFAILRTMPLGPTGKILKREIAALIREGQLVPQPVRWRGSEQGAAA
jgi:acyl-CoA synthetase